MPGDAMQCEVYKRYGADDYWVFGDDGGGVEAAVGRTYDPMTDESAVCVGEFGGLREGDLKGLLRFVYKWGLLEGANQEPTEWVWGHVRNVRLLLVLYGRLQADDLEGLERVIAAFRVDGRVEVTFAAALGMSYEDGDRDRRGWAYESIEWGDAANAARRLISTILSLNLHGGSHLVDPASFELQPTMGNLRGALYWHLQRFFARRDRVGVCLECGSFFPAIDARQKFCPPPPGVKGSPCGDRYRKRLARQR